MFLQHRKKPSSQESPHQGGVIGALCFVRCFAGLVDAWSHFGGRGQMGHMLCERRHQLGSILGETLCLLISVGLRTCRSSVKVGWLTFAGAMCPTARLRFFSLHDLFSLLPHLCHDLIDGFRAPAFCSPICKLTSPSLVMLLGVHRGQSLTPRPAVSYNIEGWFDIHTTCSTSALAFGVGTDRSCHI